MNWTRPLRFIGDVAGIALGLYCAYRLIYAIGFGGMADRVIIGGLILATLAAYLVMRRRKSN